MDFIKRTCLTFALLSTVLFFPSRGWCAKVDPYAFHTVVGTVLFKFDYERRREQETGFLDTTSTFTQDYGMSLSGNFLSRVLMIYDAFFEFERESNTTQFSKRASNNFLFDVTTTILPQSRIPLTIFGSRNRSTSNDGNSNSIGGSTTTSVGLNWTGKFQVLPMMNLSLVRNVHGSDGADDNKDLRIAYSADKAYGPTTNRFTYTASLNDDANGGSTSSSNVGLSNVTLLSRHSTFNIGLTRDASESPDLGTTNTFGLTMALSSQPSNFFSQSHNISYFRTDSDDSSFNGTSYSGSLQYELSRKMVTNITLGINKTFTESLTSSNDNTSINASSSLTYKLTKHIFLSEALNFAHSETSASEQGISNLSDRRLLEATNNINYHRSFSFLSFGASYGLGYLYDSDINAGFENNGGQAITHNGFLSFNRIDITRFFFFDVGASFSGTLKTTSGTVNDEARSYQAHFTNRFLLKYINITGGYEKTNDKSAVEAIEDKNETSDLTITSHPIKNSSIAMNLQRVVSFNDFAGFTHSNSGSVTAGYLHRILGGNFSGNISYTLLDRTFSGGSDITRTTTYHLGYERTLLRRVMWKFDADRTSSKIEASLSRDTSFTNVIFYRLRAWSLSLAHTYSIREDETREERENRILFTVGRQFVRRF